MIKSETIKSVAELGSALNKDVEVAMCLSILRTISLPPVSIDRRYFKGSMLSVDKYGSG